MRRRVWQAGGVAAARAGGAASHASAAQLRLLDLVSAPDLSDDDVDGLVTTLLRTVVDCARSLPLPEALADADPAPRRRL